jgi:VWFA-related protein
MTHLSTKAHKSVVLLIILSFGSAAFAQKPMPEQQPGVYQEDEIIRISADLAQIDLTVLDKQGHFVEGLRSDQFQLLVDGKPQTILFFEQLKTGSERETQLARTGRSFGDQKPTAEGVSPLIPTTIDRGRTVLLFADDLHLSAASMKRTRDLLLNYVDNMMGQKDQAVIATASGQLGFLQQLTGDHGVLHRAIERLTYRPSTAADTLTIPTMNEYQASAIENGDRDALSYFVDKQCDEFKRMDRGTCAVDTGMTNNAVYDDAVARGGRGGTTSGTSPGPVSGDPGTTTGRGRTSAASGNVLRPEADRLVRSRARIIARQAAQIALNTLGSLESLIRSASSLPERKLVVFISDGFFINYLRSTNAYDLRRVADAALRSGAVIYTIDARGLVTGSPEASTKDGFDPQGRYARLTITEATAAQDPLHTLASDTGGRAWVNSNDLVPGMGQALRETSGYYLVAWRPANTGDGKPRFSNIEVKLKDRPDLVVRSHAGFFDSGAKTDKSTSSAAAPAKTKTVEDHLLDIIRAPYPRRTLPTGLSVGYLSVTNGGMAVAATMMVDAGTLGDPKAAEVDVMGVVTNEKGGVLSSLSQRLTAAATQRGRMIYTMQFPNLAPGLYQVRVAARDPRTGLAGGSSQWLEVPDTSKGNFLVSSVFLSEVPVNASAANGPKVSINPDRRFARTSRMRIQAQIFNATRGAALPDLALELQLSKSGQVVIATPPSAVSTQGITDLTRIPLTAEFPLEVLEPGRYTLKIMITDRAAKKSEAQQVDFTVE